MDPTHQGGSGVALGRLVVNVASVFVAANSGLLLQLERDSEWLSYCYVAQLSLVGLFNALRLGIQVLRFA
jgi:hypothetical protein